MIFVLTYHEVRREPGADSGFYTVGADQFECQLKALVQSRWHPLSPQELLAGQVPAGPGYLLTFDDGTRDHYEVVLPLLQAYRAQAVFFVPTARLGRSEYLEPEMVRQLHQAGHAIGCHSHEHRRLDLLGEEDIRVQIQASTHRLEEITGVRPGFFAAVGGYMNRRVREVALECGMQVIRTMRWGYNLKPDLRALDCIPVNRYVSEAEFRRLMVPRSRPWIYTAKQVTKRIVPARAYAPLRALFCGGLGRK